jgi:hypothetical protein
MAVRTMQDAVITKILNSLKHRSISYSIDKCKILYDSQLKMFSS